MFNSIISVILMLLLILAGGAAVHLGLFKAHDKSSSFGRRFVTAVLSYGLSIVFWLSCYSFHYLGW